jgi:hypothetical protein
MKEIIIRLKYIFWTLLKGLTSSFWKPLLLLFSCLIWNHIKVSSKYNTQRKALNKFETQSSSRLKRRQQISNSCQENAMQLKHIFIMLQIANTERKGLSKDTTQWRKQYMKPMMSWGSESSISYVMPCSLVHQVHGLMPKKTRNLQQKTSVRPISSSSETELGSSQTLLLQWPDI